MRHQGILSSILAIGLLAACGDDDGTTDEPVVDMSMADAGGGERDAATVEEDGGGGGEDAGPADAGEGGDMGPACGDTEPAGSCAEAGVSCQCCPAGGPAVHCLCTTECTSDGDCSDPARPICNRDALAPGSMGLCTPEGFVCAWGAICASPDTPIATPEGERAIGALVPGDLVYSVEDGAVVVVPIARVAQTAVDEHRVVRLRLDGGDELYLSPGHPTADGALIGDLARGDVLGDREVLEATLVPYEYPSTHDILPESSTGAYFAAGALVGSSLAE